MRRGAPGVLAAALSAALLLSACGEGGPPADLFVVTRDGEVPGAKLQLRLTDDGGAYCNDGDRVQVSSQQLLDARELRRVLDGNERDEDAPEGLAVRGLDLPPGRGSIFRYRVRSENGTITFADTSRGLPSELSQLIKLTRDVARGPCDLLR